MNSCIIPNTVGKTKNGFLVCQGHGEPAVAILVPAFAPDMGEPPEDSHEAGNDFPNIRYKDYEQARRHNLSLAICQKGMLEMIEVVSPKYIKGIAPIYQRSIYGKQESKYMDYYTDYYTSVEGLVGVSSYWFRFSSPGYETRIYAYCRYCIGNKMFGTDAEITRHNYLRFFRDYKMHKSSQAFPASPARINLPTSSH